MKKNISLLLAAAVLIMLQSKAQTPTLTIDPSYVSTFSGNGTAGDADGIGTAATFYNPEAVTTDAAGNIYVPHNHILFGNPIQNFNGLRRLTAPGAVVSTIAGGSGGSAYITPLDEFGSNAVFVGPRDAETDATGNIYVLDHNVGITGGGLYIRKVTPAGQVSTIYTLVNTFFSPRGIAVAPNGNVYLGYDRGDGSFRQGILNVLTNTVVYEGTDYRAFPFFQIDKFAVDAQEDFIIANSQGCKIFKLSGNVLTTFAGTGTNGDNGDGGLATAADIAHPIDVDVDALGNVYVSTNNRIRKISPAGYITGLAGSPNFPNAGFADGNGINAHFNGPYGIKTNAAGNTLFISDLTNQRIRKLTAPTLAAFCTSSSLTSPSQYFSVSGVYLTGNATITPPAGYEVSLSQNSGYASSLTFTPQSGDIISRDIYVRLAAGNIPGYYNGNIVFNSAGAVNAIMPVTGIVGPLQKAGTGTALTFNGTSDYVDLGTAFNDQNFTVEMWLKPGATQQGYTDIIDNNHNPGFGVLNWVIQQDGTNTNTYYGWVSGTSTGNFNLTANSWQHLVMVKNAAALIIYINGMLISTTPYSGPVNYNSNFLRLGGFAGGGLNWNGSMDEVRIWNIALTQTEIKDRMCHKIISPDPLYSNLKAYYNFDEGISNCLFDSKNSYHGFINRSDAWIISGAPIGNFSAYSYAGGSSAVTLTHPTRGDAFSATLTGGSADGILVYNVTEAPNTTNGISGVGNNNAYFGVYVVNGTNPTYDAVYNYANAFPGNNENDFHLFKRDNNAATNWLDCNAALDINANTLTTTGQHTEYMIGSVGNALPIHLLSFSAALQNTNNVKLHWQIATAEDGGKYELQRSNDGRSFTNISQQMGNSILTQFFYADNALPNGTYYYRLKMTDKDGKITYSNIAIVKVGTREQFVSVYPNPVKRGESLLLSLQNITITKIEIINAIGQVVYSSSAKQTGSFSLPVSSSLMPGQYVIRVISESRVDVQKILIQ